MKEPTGIVLNDRYKYGLAGYGYFLEAIGEDIFGNITIVNRFKGCYSILVVIDIFCTRAASVVNGIVTH